MRSASACFRFVELPGFAVLHVGGQHDLGGPVPDLIQRAVTLKIEWRPWRVQFLTLQSISDSHTGRGGMRVVTATSKNRPTRMRARDAKTRRALHATTIPMTSVDARFHDLLKYGACSSPPLLPLLLHACALPRGSSADAGLANPQKHPPCPGARCTASPARARPPRRHMQNVMPVCSSPRRRPCAAVPRGQGYNPCSGQRIG